MLLKKWEIELPYDPATPLLGFFSKETKTLNQKDICTLMFTATLFTTAKTGEQPKCPSMEEWKKKIWYTHNEILLSHKKAGDLAICNNTDELWGHCVKWGKGDRERQIINGINYMWNLKKEGRRKGKDRKRERKRRKRKKERERKEKKREKSKEKKEKEKSN